MTSDNPLEAAFRGFVAITNSGPDGLAVGGISTRSAQSLRNSLHGDYTVVNIQRVRAIARDEHDWDIAPEDELNPAVPAHAA
jgi:predicted NAD/FAD-dependent oxidoreductase